MNNSSNVEARLQRLEDIEAIKKLKAKYWRCMDKKLWDEMEEVYTEDAKQVAGDWQVQGRKAIVQAIQEALTEPSGVASTAHGGHSPEIEITSETSAKGTWALQDYLAWKSGTKMLGFGHYEDEYIKEQGGWKIKNTKITRLFEEWTITKR
jgi:hypothetical protein